MKSIHTTQGTPDVEAALSSVDPMSTVGSALGQLRFGTVCFLNENYIFQVTCCLYYFAIAKWDTDSNKSTDFLLNPVLYIIYVCLYM